MGAFGPAAAPRCVVGPAARRGGLRADRSYRLQRLRVGEDGFRGARDRRPYGARNSVCTAARLARSGGRVRVGRLRAPAQHDSRGTRDPPS